MKPGTYRGVSAIYVFSKDSAVLMDAGEGTYGQLYDHFGSKEKVYAVLNKTRVIAISHLHADHCAGTEKMLLERDRAQS